MPPSHAAERGGGALAYARPALVGAGLGVACCGGSVLGAAGRRPRAASHAPPRTRRAFARLPLRPLTLAGRAPQSHAAGTAVAIASRRPQANARRPRVGALGCRTGQVPPQVCRAVTTPRLGELRSCPLRIACMASLRRHPPEHREPSTRCLARARWTRPPACLSFMSSWPLGAVPVPGIGQLRPQIVVRAR